MFSSIKGKFFGTQRDQNEDISELDIMKDENKILKEKYKLLFEENEKLKQTMLLGEKETTKVSNINKLFKDFKTMLFDNKSRSSLQEFKHFLTENLIYSNIDEEDIDYLNSIDVSDQNWSENKHIFIFKQRVLEKNYKDMFKNAIILNELKEFEKTIKKVNDKQKVTVSSDAKSPDRKTEPQSNPSFSNLSVNSETQSKPMLNVNIVPSIRQETKSVLTTNTASLDVFELLKDEPKNTNESLTNKNPFDAKKIPIKTSQVPQTVEKVLTTTDVKKNVSPPKSNPPVTQAKVSLSEEPSNNSSQQKPVKPVQNLKAIPNKQTQPKEKNILDIADSFDFEEFDSENLLDALHQKSNSKKQVVEPQTTVHDDEFCKIIFKYLVSAMIKEKEQAAGLKKMKSKWADEDEEN